LTHILVFENTPQHSAEVVGLLEARGYRATLVGSKSEAEELLKRDRPGALVVVDHDGAPASMPEPAASVRATAAGLGIPVLVVVDDPADPGTLVDRLGGADDWVSLGGLATELPVRVARLARRPEAPRAGQGESEGGPGNVAALALSPQFLALVVHDLRTPLNVIGLSIRMISQAVPRNDPELEEDLRFIDENFRQLERMLNQLSDYYRLHDQGNPPATAEFSPRRLVDELLESRHVKAGMRSSRITLEVTDSCPGEVMLDPVRARMAIQYAVANAAAAANGGPIRIVLRGQPDRWVTEVVVDHPPPDSVRSTPLTPAGFDRLCGVALERRGMDLAIAAKVSELFGGSARLEAERGRRTSVVLDWPDRLQTS
jgi:signal transduction histidine kinase